MDRQGAEGEGFDEGTVGGDEADAGTAVEEVGDVVGALVGHPEDQLGQGDWYLRRGRYERGPVHDTAWNAELDIAGRWLDALPIAGEIG